jgi:predicted N-acetyltransferase YhbS
MITGGMFMSIICRRYKLLADFDKASDFLRKNYRLENIVQPQFEYAHTHPYFNYRLAHRFGIWEENDEIVALACYEADLGECFLNTKLGYDFLHPEMIRYSEKELSSAGEKRELDFWVMDTAKDLRGILSQNGYRVTHTQPYNIYRYEKGFGDVKLPEGFSFITLEDENDVKKINDCLWRGFDHGDEPDDDLDCRLQMQSGPHFRKDLTTIIKAPNGEYACFAGMWLDGVNDFAYLEPLATVPMYRRMGLATAALMEAMKKTAKFGAAYCIGGSREFYQCIGFEPIANLELWHKEW